MQRERDSNEKRQSLDWRFAEYSPAKIFETKDGRFYVGKLLTINDMRGTEKRAVALTKTVATKEAATQLLQNIGAP